MTHDSLLGRAIRLPLRWIPRSARIPILRGRLRGKRWIVGSSTHGCWLGTYELPKQKRFEQVVRRGDVVYDIGGHVGFYSLLSSELVEETGRVITFEPLPRNIYYLNEHIKINHVSNIRVMGCAVADKTEARSFCEGRDSTMGHFKADGNVSVQVVDLDTLVLSGEIPAPNVLKLDIEGAEVDALNGARHILAKYRPAIFLATHGCEIHRECCRILTELGYRLESIGRLPLEESTELLALAESGLERLSEQRI